VLDLGFLKEKNLCIIFIQELEKSKPTPNRGKGKPAERQAGWGLLIFAE
jgi:hypothetical protein